jgi:hypothetical protein
MTSKFNPYLISAEFDDDPRYLMKRDGLPLHWLILAIQTGLVLQIKDQGLFDG